MRRSEVPAHLRTRAAAISDRVLAGMSLRELSDWVAKTDDGPEITELLEIGATRVDGVSQPANGIGLLLVKSRAGQPKPRLAEGLATRLVKADNAQRFSLSVAYPANRADVSRAADGFRDFASAPAVEQAAWDYLTKSPRIGLWHADGTDGAGDVVESSIYRGPDWDTGAGYVVKSGDWLLGVRWSPETWPMVVSGKIGGVSMQGSAKRRSPSAEALAALGKAAAIERQADVLSDPVMAGQLRERAGLLRDRAATPAEHLAKAARYERTAQQVADPRDREAYRQLAAQERQKAGAR